MHTEDFYKLWLNQNPDCTDLVTGKSGPPLSGGYILRPLRGFLKLQIVLNLIYMNIYTYYGFTYTYIYICGKV